jgi:sterol desaturase/sphingolipid hydroxylase (fatty acid hydroxylase superfamily)
MLKSELLIFLEYSRAIPYLKALADPMNWAPVLLGFAAFAVLERLLPARPASGKATGVSLRIAVVSGLLLSPIVAIWPKIWIGDLIQQHAADWRIYLDMRVFAWWFENMGRTETMVLTASTLTVIVAVLLGLLFVDFFNYWVHRLQHSSFLWEQHKLHHSDADLSAITAFRNHWLELTLQTVLITLPLGFLFKFTPVQTATTGLVLVLYSLFIHSNLRLNLGPLTPVILGPQAHRIHHSIEPQHQNKNFATYFPIWDIVFGTWARPGKGEYPATGVQGAASDVTWGEMLWGPFRAWRRNLINASRPAV